MNNNVVEEYLSQVFKIVMLVITGACLCAGVTISALKLAGCYPTVPWIGLGIFVGTCILYFIIGLYFVTHSYTKTESGEKRIMPHMLKRGKIFIIILCTIQYNFIAYLVPTRQFWGYAFFFLILMALFLDMKMLP